MTETGGRRRRLSRGALRAIAWVAGGAAFAAPFASLTLAPRPATAQAEGDRRVIVVKKITRRVVVQAAPDAPQIRYVYVGGGSSGSSGGGSSAPAAAPPPATTTGGS